MIYDSLEQLGQYEALIGNTRKILEVVAQMPKQGRYRYPSMTVEVSTHVPGSFDGTFKAHDKHALVVVMLEGDELVGMTYQERSKGAQRNQEGLYVIQDSPITAVLQAKVGFFIAIMPKEPFVLGLKGSSEVSQIKRLTFLLD